MGRRQFSGVVAPDATDSWVSGAPLLDGEQLEQTLAVLRRSAGILGWDVTPGADSIADHRAADEALARAWQEATDALVSSAQGGRAQFGSLLSLLQEIKSSTDRLRDAQLARQVGAGELVREALRTLDDARSVEELMSRAPVAGSLLGFDRTVLSRIDDALWVPETAFVDGDAKWADEIVQAGRDDRRTLDSSLLETQLVRARRPLLVTDLAGRSNLHRAMVDTSLTRSYAAAPIVAWGEVIGFVHADCYHQGRDLDATDRDRLWMFCEGLGYLITRAAALEDLENLSGELDRLTTETRDALREISRHGALSQGVAQPAASPGGSMRRPLSPVEGRSRPAPGAHTALTKREVDVLHLMSGGHTNGQIASRLVISEGTVKSHVKHILRKLDAANRAEAVSRWLREEHSRSTPAPGPDPGLSSA